MHPQIENMLSTTTLIPVNDNFHGMIGCPKQELFALSFTALSCYSRVFIGTVLQHLHMCVLAGSCVVTDVFPYLRLVNGIVKTWWDKPLLQPVWTELACS